MKTADAADDLPRASRATSSADASPEDDAYLTQRQSTMDSATLDKLLMAEQHLFQAGQATANAWKIIGMNPNEGDGTDDVPDQSTAVPDSAPRPPSPGPPATGTSNPSAGTSNPSAGTSNPSAATSNPAARTNRRQLGQSFHHAPSTGAGGPPASADLAQAASPRFPMAIPRADGGRASLGAYPSSQISGPSTVGMFDKPGLAFATPPRAPMTADDAGIAANQLAENGRSRSTHANLFGLGGGVGGGRDHAQLADLTLFTFTVKKSDSVLEKLGSRRASIQLQVDIDARMLRFLSPHDAPESYSCAAVTAKPQSRLGMQLKIQTGAASVNKKITFFSTEDRANFVQALEEGKVMFPKPSAHPPTGKDRGVAKGDSTKAITRGGSMAAGRDAGGSAGASNVNGSTVTEAGLMALGGGDGNGGGAGANSRAPTEIADDVSVASSDFMRSKLRDSIVTDHFGLLPGETVLEHVQRVTNLVVMSQSDRAVQGVLKITSYRITFTPYDSNWKFGSFELPLAAIDLITRDGLMLLITCKDMRTLRLAMHDAYSRKKGYDQLPSTPDFRWLNLLTLRMKPPNMIGALFAFDYHTEKTKERPAPLTEKNNGWFVYSPFAEYQRLGFLAAHKGPDKDGAITWRLLKNSKFRFSPTYPQLMVVPSLMSEEQLVQSARFRSRARLPVVVWRHPVNKSVLARSSQPNYGMAGNRSEPDRILLRAYRDSANRNSANVSPPLHIIDARKPIATKGNRLKGKGVENSQHYDNAQIEFMGIANIHKMRESWDALKSLVSPSSVEDGDKHYHNRLENTRWLKHVMRVLSGARRVAEVLHEDGASVLVHCSDGWDRTPQMVALAQLILDPYYRSIRGFAALVEKEWCSFGHKFADRIGVGKDITDQPNERSPVMMQFLDCVWQMTRQFPTCFEFNEKFLLHISDSLISGLYGTFLYNSERERFLDKVWERTESVWTPVLEHPAPFKNPLYRQTNRVLYPRANLKRVVLWDAMFFRWDPESHPDYMEYMEPVGQNDDDEEDEDEADTSDLGDFGASRGGVSLEDLGMSGMNSNGGSGGPGAMASPSILPIEAGGDLDAEEKVLRLEIDGIHDYDEFRSKLTLSDCSDMSDDEDGFDASPTVTSAFGAVNALTSELSNMAASLGDDRDSLALAHVASEFDDEALARFARAAEERTRQRAQGRNIREALQMAPDQSRIKYLEQLLSESIARELQLEAELDSMLHRLALARSQAASR